MFKIAFYQIKKIFAQKKGTFALLGMNAVPVTMFLLTLFVLIYKALSTGRVNMAEIMGYSFDKPQAHDFILIQYAFFIVSSLFFSAIMWGEILSKEFYNRTIKIELLAPFSRIEIFAGKFLGIYLFNLVSFFSGLFLIQLINGICLYKYRGGLLKILFELVIFKELLLVFLLIFMITAFLGMIAAFASSIEMCIGLGVFLNFFQALMDAVIYALNMAGDISFKTYSYLKFSYLFSFGRVFDFLIDLSRKGAPVFDAQAMTHIYAVLVYSGLFFTAGFILFSRRE